MIWWYFFLIISLSTFSATSGFQSLFRKRGRKVSDSVQLITSVHGDHTPRTYVTDYMPEGNYVQTLDVSGAEPIEWVWQKPDLNDRGHVIRGIVFLAHGCNHHSTDFFVPSISCPKCIGLPEELRISNALLRQQYAVVAVSSLSDCWDTQDYERTKRVLNILQSELGLSLPLYAIGASSGGSFVAHVPNYITGFKAVVVEIMPVSPKTFLKSNNYPPSIWITMEKDTRTMSLVRRAVGYLRRQGYVADILTAKSYPITNSYFYERIIGISLDDSRNIATALKACNFLDENSFLLYDPRDSDWRSCLQQKKELAKVLERDSLKNDLSPISEEMNVAYARHELTGNHMSDILNFLMKYK